MTDVGAPEEPAPEPTGAALTIADAARAAGSDRHAIRRKLHAGEFPNAFKDTQGFWRIYESDLRAAAVSLAGDVAEAAGDPAPAVPPAAAPVAPAPPAAPQLPADAERMRLEIVDLRHRVATAEALLAAERRLSEELARALQVARRTGDALLASVAGPPKESRSAEPPPGPPPAPPMPRANWQAELRAARARELQARAAREREERQQAASGDAGS